MKIAPPELSEKWIFIRKALDLAIKGFSCVIGGDCWDNAVSESFFHTLKIKLVHHCDFEAREEARDAIVEYIEYIA